MYPEVGPVTLQFKNGQTESAYMSQHRSEVLAANRFLSSVLLILTVSMLIVQLRGLENIEAATHVRNIIAVFISVILMAVFFAKRIESSLKPFVLELLWQTIALVSLGWLLFSSPESEKALRVLAPISLLHMGQPMRWAALVPVEVAAFLLYTFFLFTSSDGFTVVAQRDLLLLGIIILTHTCGKRGAEMSHRNLYLKVLEEGRLRSRAEADLASMKKELLKMDSQDLRSPTGSIPFTTDTGRLYESMNQDELCLSEALHLMDKMGRAERWSLGRDTVDVIQDELLGESSVDQVMKGLSNGMFVAVKVPNHELTDDDVRRLPELANELRVLHHLRHPNIVLMHGVLINAKEHLIYGVSELVDGVPLRDFVRRVTKSGEPHTLARFQIMLGICLALLYLHTHNPVVVHGDLKRDNVMVELMSKGFRARLLDFSLSRFCAQPRPIGATLGWMAPEVRGRQGPMRCSIDVYAFGCALSYLATGLSPCSGAAKSTSLKHDSRMGKLPLLMWPPGCVFEPAIKPIAEACTDTQEQRRPSMKDVHQRLIDVPDQLLLDDPRGNFLKRLQSLNSHMKDRPHRISLASDRTDRTFTPVLQQNKVADDGEERSFKLAL